MPEMHTVNAPATNAAPRDFIPQEQRVLASPYVYVAVASGQTVPLLLGLLRDGRGRDADNPRYPTHLHLFYTDATLTPNLENILGTLPVANIEELTKQLAKAEQDYCPNVSVDPLSHAQCTDLITAAGDHRLSLKGHAFTIKIEHVPSYDRIEMQTAVVKAIDQYYADRALGRPLTIRIELNGGTFPMGTGSLRAADAVVADQTGYEGMKLDAHYVNTETMAYDTFTSRGDDAPATLEPFPPSFPELTVPVMLSANGFTYFDPDPPDPKNPSDTTVSDSRQTLGIGILKHPLWNQIRTQIRKNMTKLVPEKNDVLLASSKIKGFVGFSRAWKTFRDENGLKPYLDEGTKDQWKNFRTQIADARRAILEEGQQDRLSDPLAPVLTDVGLLRNTDQKSAWCEFRDAGIAGGVLRVNGGDVVVGSTRATERRPPGCVAYREIPRKLIKGGEWLEYAVYAAVRGLQHDCRELGITDVRHSFHPLRRRLRGEPELTQEHDLGEIDVAVVCRGRLYLIECKDRSIEPDATPWDSATLAALTHRSAFGGRYVPVALVVALMNGQANTTFERRTKRDRLDPITLSMTNHTKGSPWKQLLVGLTEFFEKPRIAT